MEPITVLYWLCILAAPAVLLLAAVRCLYLDRGWRRNVLALILGLLVGALLLWLGGGWVLSRFGLAWRAWLASLLLGAALVLAGLAAKGQTRVDGIHYIKRGYEDLPGTLRELGARITEEQAGDRNGKEN